MNEIQVTTENGDAADAVDDLATGTDGTSLLTSAVGLDWSRIVDRRREIQRRYPSIWSVTRLRKRHQLFRMAFDGVDPIILDVGASRRDLERRLRKVFPACDYQSMDIDRSTEQDFYELQDVPRDHYDIVTSFEVVEHITPKDVRKMFQQIHRVLKPGGSFILTTPNIFHPHQYFHDVTHITPWAFDELGGFLLDTGYEVTSINRLHNEPTLKWWLRLILGYPLHRILDIDYAKTLTVLARKA